jgi:Pilus assembly protein, PilO
VEHAVKRIREIVGLSGLVALVLLLAAAAFSSFILARLEAHNRALLSALSRKPAAPALAGAEKVDAVYEYLRKEEQTTDWLAKLHAIGAATGVQFKSGSYRTLKTDARIVRYEIVLPVTGSYPQIRDFLKRALQEIPIVSLDQITMKRGTNPENHIQTEMRLTLHMVKS